MESANWPVLAIVAVVIPSDEFVISQVLLPKPFLQWTKEFTQCRSVQTSFANHLLQYFLPWLRCTFLHNLSATETNENANNEQSIYTVHVTRIRKLSEKRKETKIPFTRFTFQWNRETVFRTILTWEYYRQRAAGKCHICATVCWDHSNHTGWRLDTSTDEFEIVKLLRKSSCKIC